MYVVAVLLAEVLAAPAVILLVSIPGAVSHLGPHGRTRNVGEWWR